MAISWELSKRINRFLDEVERILGEKFIEKYAFKIVDSNGENTSVILANRGNWFDLETITFSLSDDPAQVAAKIRELVRY
jgi:hypothetical protein